MRTPATSYSTRDVAEIWGVQPRTVKEQCQRGTIRAYKLGPVPPPGKPDKRPWAIPVEAIDPDPRPWTRPDLQHKRKVDTYA